jgi:hypothetical protein
MAVRPKLVGDPEHIDPLLALGADEPAPQPGVQEHCHVCGLVNGGCFGFGVLRGHRGVWACEEAGCRAEAKSRANRRAA